MRIVYFAGYGSNFPSRDANSIHIMRMCEAFSQIGHEVILYVSGRGKKPTDIFKFYGIRESFRIAIVKVPLIKGKTLIYSIKAGLSAWKLKPEIAIGRSAQACALSAILGTNVIYDAHGPVWEISRIEFFSYRLLYNNRNLIRMTSNSRALKSIYEKEGLVPKCGIIVAHNGSLLLPLEDMPQEWPGRSESLQVGYIGHLYPGRGVEIILACAERLQEFDFHIIGGNQEDIDYWRTRVCYPNLYFHGFIPHAEIYRYRNRCDVLLAPYGSEKVSLAGGGGDQSRYMNPIKIIEYMSSNKAIICSDIPVLRELLDDDSALFVNPGNVDEWITAINKLKDSVLREKIAANAYSRFMGKLTWTERAGILLNGL